MSSTTSTSTSTINNTNNPTTYPSNPLYIHPFDHPSLVLEPKVLDGTNYTMWRKSLLASLRAKNKHRFIKRTLHEQSKSNPSNVAWHRCKDMVLSWLYNSLNSDLASNFLYAATPPEIWQDLEERFSQGDFPQ
ncbi:hypothetical protein Dimus_039151 [Dionaea muscipula]